MGADEHQLSASFQLELIPNQVNFAFTETATFFLAASIKELPAFTLNSQVIESAPTAMPLRVVELAEALLFAENVPLAAVHPT